MGEAPKIQVQPLDDDALKARKRRNLWLGLALAGFVVLVMITTIIRLTTGTGVSERM
jgi:hypothetical protein